MFYKLEEKYDEFNKRSDFEHNIINTQSIQSDNLSIYQKRFMDSDSISILCDNQSSYKDGVRNSYSLTNHDAQS